MRLRVVRLFLCCTIYFFVQSASAESQDYLGEASLSLPTNGSKIRTPKPLAPYTSYRIRIVSPYNLRQVYSESQGNYETDILIDGIALKAISYDEASDGYITSVEFLYRGLGKPISIGFGKDHHEEIENAQIEIYIEGVMARIWRENLEKYWREYADMIIFCLIAIPIIVAGGNYLIKRNRRIREEERKAEKERQALMLSSHNKSLEVMREIDLRAQQKAQEIMARNYDELQKKILFWRTRAYTESYFLNAELRQKFAVANRERIINELENKWAEECLEIARDLSLAEALREQEPGVMHWIQARQEVVNLAHNLTWSTPALIDAYYEEISDDPQIISVDEIEEAEEAGQSRA